MTTLDSTHLFDVHLELGAIDTIGQTPYEHRVVGNLGGGRFEGERLSGRVLPSGGDWGLFLPDGTLVVDGRATYETHDGALFYVDFVSRRAGCAPRVPFRPPVARSWAVAGCVCGDSAAEARTRRDILAPVEVVAARF